MLINGLIKFCDAKSKNMELKAEPQVYVEIKLALEELKAIKSDGFTDHLLNMGYTKGYRKAIDEFAEKLKCEMNENILPDDEKFKYNRKQQEQICHQNMTWKMAIKYVDYIAEQLKGGAE